MKKTAWLILGAVSSLFLSACTTTQYALTPQSHFDYPNSNIKPLGTVKGEASQVSFFLPPLLSGSIQRAAVENAINKKAGADLLLNYLSETKVTNLVVLPLYIMTYKVYGTAAAMTVGKQHLK